MKQKKSMKSYMDQLPQWQSILKNKDLLFDTDAVISILSFGALGLLREFEVNQTTLCYIPPVHIELLNTNKLSERVKRQALLDSFKLLVWRVVEDKYLDLQIDLHKLDCYPSPTDIFLGSVLAFYKANLFLITSNLQDFPSPIFKRVSGIILQNNKQVKVLSILQYVDENESETMNKSEDEDIPF